MEHDANSTGQRTPWNKGKMIGQKPPLKLKEIWAIRIRLQLTKKVRELAMFNLAIDSKLRGCDLVSLKVRDVTHGNQVSPRASVMQHKTQWPVQFELTNPTREAVGAWIAKAKLKPDFGSAFTIVRNPKDELKTGTFHAMCSQLGIKPNDL